jgi:redox-sensitive bicupin YhaK (pirin superfamily)
MHAPVRSVLKVAALGFPFSTPDPFLFAVFHNDKYPPGELSGMHAPIRGNGADFDWSKPFRMYHGENVPGFPVHPHRGFETLSVVLHGLVDHADSLGAGGRYGEGDLQWMSAGRGVQHQEMFPLVHTDRPNTLHFYQLWLNLPAKDKLCEPSYNMIWAETVPAVEGAGGGRALVYAGSLAGARAGGSPPPRSWAADAANDVGVFVVQLPPGGSFELPPAAGGAAINRMAYVTLGAGVEADGEATPPTAALTLRADAATRLRNPARAGGADAEILVLQGRPIGEPVAQRGPFVMNTQAELREASRAYAETQFGGWPWRDEVVLFPRGKGRHALRPRADGGPADEERPPPPPAAPPAPAEREL